MNETQQKGLTTELQVQLKLVQRGLDVYLPISYDSRCDLIVNILNKLYKIQIKTSRLTETGTGITFNTYSSRMNHTDGNIKQKYSTEDVDFFATIYNDELYLIPIQDCQGNQRTLTFNNQKTNGSTVYFIEDYQVDKIIQSLESGKEISKENLKTYVVQIDKDSNEILNKYTSNSEASRAIGKGSAGAGHISQVIQGKRHTAYGYIWKSVTE